MSLRLTTTHDSATGGRGQGATAPTLRKRVYFDTKELRRCGASTVTKGRQRQAHTSVQHEGWRSRPSCLRASPLAPVNPASLVLLPLHGTRPRPISAPLLPLNSTAPSCPSSPPLPARTPTALPGPFLSACAPLLPSPFSPHLPPLSVFFPGRHSARTCDDRAWSTPCPSHGDNVLLPHLATCFHLARCFAGAILHSTLGIW